MEGVGARMVEVDDIVAAVGEGMCGMRGTPCLGCCAKKKITEHYFFDMQCLQKTPPQRIQTKMLFIFKEHYFAQNQNAECFYQKQCNFSWQFACKNLQIVANGNKITTTLVTTVSR